MRKRTTLVSPDQINGACWRLKPGRWIARRDPKFEATARVAETTTPVWLTPVVSIASPLVDTSLVKFSAKSAVTPRMLVLAAAVRSLTIEGNSF